MQVYLIQHHNATADSRLFEDFHARTYVCTHPVNATATVCLISHLWFSDQPPAAAVKHSQMFTPGKNGLHGVGATSQRASIPLP